MTQKPHNVDVLTLDELESKEINNVVFNDGNYDDSHTNIFTNDDGWLPIDFVKKCNKLVCALLIKISKNNLNYDFENLKNITLFIINFILLHYYI